LTIALHDALPIYGGYLTRVHWHFTYYCPSRPVTDYHSKTGFIQIHSNRVIFVNSSLALNRIGFFEWDAICSQRPLCLRRYRRSCPSKRSEEHTSELQSREILVCRLPLGH